MCLQKEVMRSCKVSFTILPSLPWRYSNTSFSESLTSLPIHVHTRPYIPIFVSCITLHLLLKSLYLMDTFSLCSLAQSQYFISPSFCHDVYIPSRIIPFLHARLKVTHLPRKQHNPPTHTCTHTNIDSHRPPILFFPVFQADQRRASSIIKDLESSNYHKVLRKAHSVKTMRHKGITARTFTCIHVKC